MKDETAERDLSEDELCLFEKFLKVMDPALQYPIESRLAIGAERIMLAISGGRPVAGRRATSDSTEAFVTQSPAKKP